MKCRKTSCIYHTGNHMYGCNYMFVTGISKLGQMPQGEQYKVEDCKFYSNGKKRSARKMQIIRMDEPEEIVKETATVDGKILEELVELDLCDADIAHVLNVSQKTVVRLRRKKGLIRSMSKSGGIRRINWDDVDTMLADGFSDIAVAMYVSVSLEVIQRYKVIKAMRGTKGVTEENAEEV